MSDEQHTRCPACRTVFRVTPQQLAVRAGQVRCGHCQTVFDGRAQLLRETAPPAVMVDSPEYDEATMGPATMTLRMPQPAGASPPIGRVRPLDYEERFAAAQRGERRRAATVAYGIGVPLLLLLLAGQALYHFRDLIVARWPGTRPAMVELCRLARCEIVPVHDVAGLSIEASDLQADPSHRGLLILTATIRNRSAWPLGYPHLELTLTDARDQVVARRALPPAEYAGGTADLANGIPSNAEVPVKIFVDASATTQAGYRLYLFYP